MIVFFGILYFERNLFQVSFAFVSHRSIRIRDRTVRQGNGKERRARVKSAYLDERIECVDIATFKVSIHNKHSSDLVASSLANTRSAKDLTRRC